MEEWTAGWMGGVRRLRIGALHIAIDPQGGPIKDGVTFMAPTDSAGLPLSSRPQTAVTTSAVLVGREKKKKTAALYAAAVATAVSASAEQQTLSL